MHASQAGEWMLGGTGVRDTMGLRAVARESCVRPTVGALFAMYPGGGPEGYARTGH